jgi:hypothetical protein
MKYKFFYAKDGGNKKTARHFLAVHGFVLLAKDGFNSGFVNRL